MDDDMTAFSGLARDVWPLPPRGISIAKTNHRAGELIQYTYLCDQNETCKAVAYSQVSEQHARDQIAGHACPEIDGSRGRIPTGKTLVQKMWDEADDAMDAYRGHRSYKSMSGERLTGYICGIAEVLTFCTVPSYKVTNDVLKELYRRWKMRDGQIPFAPTPSYNYHPHLDAARAKSISEQTAPKPARPLATKKQPVKRSIAPLVDLLPAQLEMIRESYHAGKFDEAKLADLFGVSVERVRAIVAVKPTTEQNNVIVSAVLFWE